MVLPYYAPLKQGNSGLGSTRTCTSDKRHTGIKQLGEAKNSISRVMIKDQQQAAVINACIPSVVPICASSC